MTMFIYLFPIFAFGLVITAIVFLGLQQASDWAKDLTAQRNEADKNSKSPEVVAPKHNSAAVIPKAETIRS